MKLRLNLTRIGLVLATLLGGLHTASAFYDPGSQRWLNRDPIEEEGGLNLYVFAGNNPMTWVDMFGLDCTVSVNGNNVTINVPITYTGAGATKETTDKFNKGIEKNWSGQFGKFNVTTKVTTPQPGGPVNTIDVPKGNGRAEVNKVGGNKGTWPSDRPGWTAAHETGHLMGLPDQYTDKGGPKKGFKNDIMGARDKPPLESDIQNIIKGNPGNSGSGTPKKECQ